MLFQLFALSTVGVILFKGDVVSSEPTQSPRSRVTEAGEQRPTADGSNIHSNRVDNADHRERQKNILIILADDMVCFVEFCALERKVR